MNNFRAILKKEIIFVIYVAKHFIGMIGHSLVIFRLKYNNPLLLQT